MTALDAFAVGENVARTPVQGRVPERAHAAAVHGPCHQRHRERPRGVISGGHERDGREHRNHRLTDREHVHVGSQQLHQLDHVIDVAGEVELAFGGRDVADVEPLSDMDVVLREQRLHRAAQQRREVPREGGTMSRRGSSRSTARSNWVNSQNVPRQAVRSCTATGSPSIVVVSRPKRGRSSQGRVSRSVRSLAASASRPPGRSASPGGSCSTMRRVISAPSRGPAAATRCHSYKR